METIVYIFAYIFVVPIVARAAVKFAVLDAKLDPEPGEDETRVLLLRLEQLKGPEAKRLNRSFCRRWLRAANYSEENIVRTIDGKPVDNCPRLTRAKRNLRRSLTEDHTKAAVRMKTWRETGDNLQNELDLQRIRREIEAEANFHATITIDDVECERAIIAVDGEGMDGGPETIIERGGVLGAGLLG